MILPNGQLTSRSGYIPNEVLSIIFAYAIPLDHIDCTTPHPLEAPLNVSQVCKLWRQVALSTARLWDGVHFARGPERIYDSKSLLDLWIKRSAHLPIGIRLGVECGDGILFEAEMENNPDYEFRKGIRLFVESALSCSDRWRVIEFFVPEMPFATPIMQALVKSTTIQHIGISSRYLGLYEQPQDYDFSNNQNLETVRLVTPIIRPAIPPEVSVALRSLVSLDLHFCPSFQTCLTWIDMCPNLVSLVLRLFITDDGIIPRQARHIRTLPMLEKLELTFLAATSRCNPGQLLDSLSCPSLKSLEVDLNHMYDADQWAHAGDLLGRSQTRLKELTLLGTPMSPADVLQCLVLSPDLVQLVTDYAMDAVVDALSPRRLPEGIASPSMMLMDHLSPMRREQSLRAAGGGNPADEEVSLLQEMDLGFVADSPLMDDNGAKDELKEPEINPSEDPRRYALLCPKLEYFEVDDVDSVSLKSLCTLMVTRCEEFLPGVAEFVDEPNWDPRPTPKEFKTLSALILPYDAMYNMLSHPTIIKRMEESVYF